MGKLTPKQARFVAEYLVDLNATQAAVRAGFSPRTAHVTAHHLLTEPKVAEAVQKAQQKRAHRTEITQDRVLEELGVLAFSNVRHYVVDDKGEVALAEGAPEAAWRALSSVKRKITTRTHGELTETTREVELKLWDKPGPLKLAGLHTGLKFVERHEHTGKDGKPIETLTKVVFGGRHRKGNGADAH